MSIVNTPKRDWADARRSNVFVSIKPVHEKGSFKLLLEEDYSLTSEGLDRESYLKQLSDVELEKKSNGKTTYFYRMTVLLGDGKRTVKEIQKLIKTCLKQIFRKTSSLHPYIGRIYQQGNGNFVEVYFSERPYYPNGKEIVKKQASDLYVNSETRKICKKDDPNAILSKQKGTVLSKEFGYFGVKERALMVPGNIFNAIVGRIKGAFLSEWERITKSYVSGITIRKKNKNKGNKDQRYRKAIWNDKVTKLEQHLEDMIRWAHCAGLDGDEMKKVQKRIGLRLRQIFEETERYDTGRVVLVVNERRSVRRISELFETITKKMEFTAKREICFALNR